MTDRKDHIDALALTLVAVCCVFWSFQQILIKQIVYEVPPLWQSSLRFAGATVLLLVWCRLRGIPLMARDGTLVGGLVAGALFAFEFACLYLGMRETNASRLTVFVYTAPFVVALLLPRLVPSERLHLWQWLGLVLAFGGMSVAFAEGFMSGPSGHWRGDTLSLLAGVGWGLTTLVLRSSKLGSASAEKILFYQVGVTAVVAPFLSLALGETWSLNYSAYAWFSISMQTLIGAFASFLAWMWLLRHYPATQLSSFTFITPVTTLVLGVLVLGETLTPQLMTAAAGVAIGIILVNRRRPA